MSEDGCARVRISHNPYNHRQLEACTIEGRLDLLRSLGGRLELCQRSLNEYLDTKKKLFPRFYFVSNVRASWVYTYVPDPAARSSLYSTTTTKTGGPPRHAGQRHAAPQDRALPLRLLRRPGGPALRQGESCMLCVNMNACPPTVSLKNRTPLTQTRPQDEEGKESARTVDAMVAKDKERVPLHAPFTMEGAWFV